MLLSVLATTLFKKRFFNFTDTEMRLEVKSNEIKQTELLGNKAQLNYLVLKCITHACLLLSF